MRLAVLFTRRFVFRAWYMLRVGYGTYLTYPLSIFGTLVAIYYLLVDNAPLLKTVFPSFTFFTIIAVLVGLPLGIFLGHAHFKRTRAYASEQDISVEANPWYYLLTPGKQEKIDTPLLIANIDLSIKMAQALEELSGRKVLEPETEQELLQARWIYKEMLRNRDAAAKLLKQPKLKP